MVKALFDTNILIDYLNGIDAAATELQRYRDRAISLITWMEVMVGTTEEEIPAVKGLLSQFELVPISLDIASAAVPLRQILGLNLPDAIILASAQVGNRLLVTRDTKDFPPGFAGVRIPYLVEQPPAKPSKRTRR